MNYITCTSNIVDINDNNQTHFPSSFQKTNMIAIWPPPKTRKQEYVTRTLCSMEDDVCDWDRLNTLVLYYYHNYSQGSTCQDANRDYTWLEKRLVKAKVDLEEVELNIIYAMLANTSRLKLMTRQELCTFMSGFQFLSQDLSSLKIRPNNLDVIVRNCLMDVEASIFFIPFVKIRLVCVRLSNYY